MSIHVFSSYTFFQFHHAMTQHWQLELHQLELQQIRQEHLGHHCPGNPRAGAPDFWAKFTKWMSGKKHGKTTCPHPAKKLRNQRLYVQNRSRKNQASKHWFLITFFQGQWPIVSLGWRTAVLCGWTYLFVAIGMSNTICSALSLGLHGTHHSTGSCVCIIWTCFFEKPSYFHVHTFMRIPKTSTISLALTSTSKLTMIPPKHTHKRHRHGSSLNLCWCGRRRIMNFLCLQTLILGSMLQGSLNWYYKMNTGDLIPTKWYGLWTPVSTFPSLSTTTYSRLLWKSKDV